MSIVVRLRNCYLDVDATVPLVIAKSCADRVSVNIAVEVAFAFAFISAFTSASAVLLPQPNRYMQLQSPSHSLARVS